ncbi:uncharacterized protein K460DRAFT_152331 [Cucurbitaria berberidis CBS 394.84]|uniref:Uncharacterized protein n=1 Tax=Cucurbitaria berberidis CBS 394.84 TaxID=1168544 RepID=A0A9P4GE49_9PLEO|nr:uncharacterized protein K460DRAFT_152331 [Cucurbitaria berberidis CBS 394.84]KAF1843841.1 hypothetical protein K460DRAFT_152331 [Cucurbitaria berberidis CBS 394.84]
MRVMARFYVPQSSYSCFCMGSCSLIICLIACKVLCQSCPFQAPADRAQTPLVRSSTLNEPTSPESFTFLGCTVTLPHSKRMRLQSNHVLCQKKSSSLLLGETMVYTSSIVRA